MKRREQDRQRSHTVCFWASPEERQQIEARITVSGMPKGQYYIQSLLYQKIDIVVGKYQSDRLSLEIRRLRTQIESMGKTSSEVPTGVLGDCKALLTQLLNVMNSNNKENTITAADFGAKK